MRRVKLSFVLFIILAPAGILGFYNFYADNTREQAMAEREACAGEQRCRTRMARLERTPFHQQFRFNLERGRSVDVRCTRSYYLLGDYSCRRVGQPR